MSVWKRLQRVGKRASKYQFTASYQELSVECTKKWQPNKLCISWCRRSRRECSELHAWEPTVDNAYRGLVVWSVPENVNITVSLFRDAKQGHYEDKEWTFVVEDQDKRGHRKPLASKSINMKDFANPLPTQTQLTLNLKPVSTKVVSVTLTLTISSVFLREGNATDDDMQSMVSVFNTDRSYDIGNIADIDDDEEGHSSVLGDENTSACISELAAQIEAFNLDSSTDALVVNDKVHNGSYVTSDRTSHSSSRDSCNETHEKRESKQMSSDVTSQSSIISTSVGDGDRHGLKPLTLSQSEIRS